MTRKTRRPADSDYDTNTNDARAARGRPVTTGRGHDGPRVNIRFSPEEMNVVATAATRAGQTVAEYVRTVAINASSKGSS